MDGILVRLEDLGCSQGKRHTGKAPGGRDTIMRTHLDQAMFIVIIIIIMIMRGSISGTKENLRGKRKGDQQDEQSGCPNHIASTVRHVRWKARHQTEDHISGTCRSG